jgi:hypothetical protein
MRVEFTPSPALFPFQSRWFETNGIRVARLDRIGGLIHKAAQVA